MAGCRFQLHYRIAMFYLADCERIEAELPKGPAARPTSREHAERMLRDFDATHNRKC